MVLRDEPANRLAQRHQVAARPVEVVAHAVVGAEQHLGAVARLRPQVVRGDLTLAVLRPQRAQPLVVRRLILRPPKGGQCGEQHRRGRARPAGQVLCR